MLLGQVPRSQCHATEECDQAALDATAQTILRLCYEAPKLRDQTHDERVAVAKTAFLLTICAVSPLTGSIACVSCGTDISGAPLISQAHLMLQRLHSGSPVGMVLQPDLPEVTTKLEVTTKVCTKTLVPFLRSFLLNTVVPDDKQTENPFRQLLTSKHNSWKTVKGHLLNFLAMDSNQQGTPALRTWLQSKGNKARDTLKALNHLLVHGEWCVYQRPSIRMCRRGHVQER